LKKVEVYAGRADVKTSAREDGYTLATKNLITDLTTLSAQLYDILWNCYKDAQ